MKTWREQGRRAYHITFENGKTISLSGIDMTPEEAIQCAIGKGSYEYKVVNGKVIPRQPDDVRIEEYTEADDIRVNISNLRDQISVAQQQIMILEQRLYLLEGDDE